MNQADIKKELILLCETYFNSIESLFEYRNKHIKTYNVVSTIYVFSTLTLVFTIIPMIPYIFEDVILKSIGKTLKLSTYVIPVNNFFVRWLLSLLFVGLIFLISLSLKNYLKNSNKKHSIPSGQLSFAYIAKTIKQLKMFLINDRLELTVGATDYLRRYYRTSDAYMRLMGQTDLEAHFLPDIINNLRDQHFWIEFDKKTLQVIETLKYFEPKIIKRIQQQKEIDQVVDWLSNLLIYKYSKIKKTKEDDKFTNQKLSELGEIFFFDFCECVNIAQILKIETSDIDLTSKKGITKTLINFFETIFNLFTHKLIIISFTCWLFLLSTIFVIFIYTGIKIFNLHIDNTLFITALSGIVLGTITITATIYTKRQP